ncbi:MAG: hypothetical protein QXO75_10770, partial [Nitrososphaerota archaeon]
PKGRAEIIEVEGDKEIIVVIPTADFNGKYAKECRENIFKGLHIIFVESGFPKDPYFNCAHNFNVGIKKAMEYNPKWIVVSNDDMVKIDEISILVENLKTIDPQKVNVVLAKNNKNNFQNGSRMKICQLNIFGKLAIGLLSITHLYKCSKILEQFLIINKINEHFGNKLIILFAQMSVFFSKFFKTKYNYTNFEDFGIFSSSFVKKTEMFFDETYINAHEDHDLSIRLSFNPEQISFVNFKIKGVGGQSLGSNFCRGLRTIASDSYFNFKWKEKLGAMYVNMMDYPTPH